MGWSWPPSIRGLGRGARERAPSIRRRGADATDGQRGADEVAHDRPEHPLVREEAKVPARADDVRPAACPVGGRWHDWVVLGEDRELLRGVRVREVRCAERHEASYAACAVGLNEVTCDEPAQAVRDDVDLSHAGVTTYSRQVLAETRGQPLVVEPREIAEAREAAYAVPGQVAAQGREVRRVAEDAVHEDDGDAMPPGFPCRPGDPSFVLRSIPRAWMRSGADRRGVGRHPRRQRHGGEHGSDPVTIRHVVFPRVELIGPWALGRSAGGRCTDVHSRVPVSLPRHSYRATPDA